MRELLRPRHTPARAAVLMSGSGTNAKALLDYVQRSPRSFEIVVLMTDAPETSRARELADGYQIPLLECDIRAFYRAHGENIIKLDTPHRRELRDEWSALLWTKLQAFEVDFGLLAGFVPLTNLTAHLPCLNVHPGDLTREDELGNRLYAGLHFLPVEKAILNGDTTLRSSVILAQTYSGAGGEMDSGAVLGVSVPIPVALGEFSLAQLREIKAQRLPGQPVNDALRLLAKNMVEQLKIAGDHVIFPQAAADFAAGNFAQDGELLYYRTAEAWQRVKTVEYATCNKRLLNN